ncbi:MAG: hypothetical protein Nkreftii_000062 [Candidatus Nitrospira kreftii]|uniref:Uncharacterized protein n=1 Tax=Candidatus Nitrospira kreftii TaxID=2652173 RepID=A0A7S8FAJ1_9BACT|nr:MAG: hypothetical protein Nkreftii_000062 [Candidatus Nitrospira kreftii]
MNARRWRSLERKALNVLVSRLGLEPRALALKVRKDQ